MKHEITQLHGKGYQIRDDGMLFVRTEGILETMAKLPLIMAGLIVIAIAIPTQTSFGSTRTLELSIYSDGSTHISSQIDVDPLTPDFTTNLFGPSVDNLVAIGENDFLLSSEIIDDKAIIDTFGSSTITITYDIHDLVSKEGRVWTFSFNSPSDYVLLMPENSVIVGMSALPNNMELIDEQIRLELSNGPAEISYIFSTSPPPIIPTETNNSSLSDYTLAIIGVSLAAIVGGIVVVLNKKKSLPKNPEKIIEKSQPTKSTDIEKIFSLVPDMRDDDKEIVKFISENGGQVFESTLRKKFLQPRTTMWRAVKRLERLGVVEIIKKDLQNMVKLRDNLGEEI